MTSKFEQLIEYVINDEEAKAKELFHDIVVEKSREIYENLMNEEEEDLDEAKEEDSEEELDESAEEELDESMEEEEMDESIGGDASDDLIDDVETDESGMMENDEEFDDEAEEDGEDMTHDMEKDHDEGDIEDRVVDLEDKLDELMAEFESLMAGEEGENSDLAGEEGEELAGDALAQDDTMAFADDQMMENVTLDKVPAPTHGDDGANNKSPVAFNSGAKGMAASPVKMTGDTAQGRPAPKSGDLPEAGKFKNVPGKGTANSKLATAPKPVTAQAAGVNTKTPFPKG
jgi:hypothetical protein